MGTAGRIAIGIVAALGGQFVALMVGAAGHGWTAPFLFSLPLLVAYPVTMVRAFSKDGSMAWIEISLLMFGLAADVALFHNIAYQEREYFDAVLEISVLPIVWIIYWLSWQILIAVGLSIRNSDAG